MKQILDYTPLVIFVVVYFQAGMVPATAVMMIAYALQVVLLKLLIGKIEKSQAITVAVVMVTGALTIIFDDPVFVLWQPTILNWGACLFLFSSLWFASDYMLKRGFGRWLQLPDRVWRNITLGWSLGFFIGGAANLWVAYHYSTDFWVQYKLVGGPSITFTYIAITFMYLYVGKYIFSEKTNLSEIE